MKRIVFILLLLIPFIVNAENCEVVTGTGKDIGDEIKCGTESFYLVDYNETQTKMLAKYNLLVGDNIDYIEIENPEWVEGQLRASNEPTEEMFNYCNNLVEEKNYNAYYTYPMIDAKYEEVDNKYYYMIKGCRVYEKIESDHIRQDERAVGTVIKNGKSVLPLYGITYMVPEWGYEAIKNNVIKENVYDANGDFIVTNSSFEGYINGYKEELESQNINVQKVEFFKINNFINVLKEISKEEINLELHQEEHEWDIPQNYSYDDLPNYYISKMDVTNYIKDNDWLYSTTYWIGSGFVNNRSLENQTGSESEYNDYYMSNEGILCALGRGECGYFKYPIGNGLRPVITVENKNITYILGEANSQDSIKQVEAPENPKTGAVLTKGLIVFFIILAAGALQTCFIAKRRELL